MSAKDLATAAHMSPGHLSELEQGKRNLTDSLAERLAGAVNVEMADFMRALSEIAEDLPLPSNDLSGTKVQDDVISYRAPPRQPSGQPPDDYRELAALFVKLTPKADAWKMVRDLTDSAEAGDYAAGRCARALINLLSSPES